MTGRNEQISGSGMPSSGFFNSIGQLRPVVACGTAMFRYKAIVGSSLGARTLPAQKTEAKVTCSVLNRITKLGMPASQRVH